MINESRVHIASNKATNIWFDITKSYIKNASFRITDVKVLNKDTTNSSEQQNKDQNTTY